jgi:hypothetical protein
MEIDLSNLRSLDQVGIAVLTGEACAYGLRLLCDLNEDGVSLVTRCFGMSPTTPLAKNWNVHVGGKPAVASVMLGRDVFHTLARFALYDRGYRYIIESGTEWTNLKGVNELPAWVHDGADRSAYVRIRTNPKNPSNSRGDRNIHQMSGRAA